MMPGEVMSHAACSMPERTQQASPHCVTACWSRFTQRSILLCGPQRTPSALKNPIIINCHSTHECFPHKTAFDGTGAGAAAAEDVSCSSK
jgi:hypothetical protein